MALGATRSQVFLLVMRQVAILLAIGVLAGGVAALFAARSIRTFLFEVQPRNPRVFVFRSNACNHRIPCGNAAGTTRDIHRIQ
jgi:predicted lysophospholipase L1 biosynthesis ABC-type transport system permease subunit